MIEEVITGRGKAVHVVSEDDLMHVRKVGRRIRACCPVHNSRERDVSIAPYSDSLDDDDQRRAGWGFCHAAKCGATILVAEWNPKAAGYLLKRKDYQPGPPRVVFSADELDQAEEWQIRELEQLNKIYDTAASQLQHPRALAYLQQRGIASPEALALLARLGVGYIPQADEWKRKPTFELRRWCDRVIFPFLARGDNGSNERGFVGRALALWQPGMDESEHKRLLNEHDARMEEIHGKEEAGRYQIRRWLKTYRSGFFNGQVIAEYEHLYVTEGAFDAIPLMLAGLPNTIAVAGSFFDIQAMPKTVFSTTVAFDGDTQGKAATAKTLDALAGIGIQAGLCVPPDDDQGKDWSERYRRAGLAGLAVLFDRQNAEQDSEPEQTTPDNQQQEELAEEIYACADCGAIMRDGSTRDFFFWGEDGTCYCEVCRDCATGLPYGLPYGSPVVVEQASPEPEIVQENLPEQGNFVDIINEVRPAEPEQTAPAWASDKVVVFAQKLFNARVAVYPLRRDFTPTATEREVITRLAPYRLRVATWACHRCRCYLEWPQLGTWKCARCHPGGTWTTASMSLLVQSCQPWQQVREA